MAKLENMGVVSGGLVSGGLGAWVGGGLVVWWVPKALRLGKSLALPFTLHPIIPRALRLTPCTANVQILRTVRALCSRSRQTSGLARLLALGSATRIVANSATLVNPNCGEFGYFG
jgi:hypothetical protein